MRDRLKRANIAAVNEHQYDYIVGTMFGDLIGSLERLGDYVVNVVEARFGK
jgi:phosphate:Na+ symporter